MNNQVVQTVNKATVVGILKDKKIDFKVSSTGRQMAIGKLVVVCNTPLGKGEVEIKVMQMETKKDGTPNALYKALQTIENTYRTEVTHGEGNGEVIKVEGQLEDGTYYSVNKGDFVEKLEIKGTFINRVDEKEAHGCKVNIEGLISSITPVNDELEVEIVGIGYEGVAMPVKAMIPSNLVADFQSKYAVGCTTSLYISILKTVITEEVSDEAFFGDKFGEKITRSVTKKIIFGGSNVKYAGTVGAINPETAKQGLAIRQAKLESKKEDAIKRTSGGANMNVGFGAPQGTGFGAPQIEQGFGTMGTGFGGFGGFPQ